MPFSAVFDVSTLNGANGFRIDGVIPFSQTGRALATLDINGDGLTDLVLGAPAGISPGYVYVVFGKVGGFGTGVNLATLDGTNGFRLQGEVGMSYTGIAVSSAGDFNGDGFTDLIIGADRTSFNGSYSGSAYIYFGKGDGFAGASTLSPDGYGAMRLDGETSTRAGVSVASAGDVNGDGYDDVIVGAPYAFGGMTFVVYGRPSDGLGTVSMLFMDGTNGFTISNGGDQVGVSVSAAGDINGDGKGDLIIGVPRTSEFGFATGSAYVWFGGDDPGAYVDLATVDGTNGFKLTGEGTEDLAGFSVSSAGDVNGDGFDDIIVGARGGGAFGKAYVVYGKASGFTSNLLLSSLDGVNGFQIVADSAGQTLGAKVTRAGDINGDGVDDLLVSAPYSDRIAENSGAAYVVFGRAGGLGATVDVSTLNGANGFRIDGLIEGGWLGIGVAGAGDLNNDGYDDLMIGARQHTGPGAIGATYVIYGGPGAPSSIISPGSAGNDITNGAAANDQLSGQGGNDVLSGFAGDDILDGGDLSDQLFGGDGADDLIGGGGGDILYGDDGADELSGGDGADKLFGGTGADLLNGGTGNDRMDGQSDIDVLNGGTGNDYLDGGLGADVMTGGLDNDIYIVDDAGDQTIELAGEGYDIVRTAVDGLTLADNIEGLELQGSADIDGNGNGGANNLQGNAGANRLDGGGGVDTINGNDGDDIIVGGLGNDLLRGGTGADTFVVAHSFGSSLETDQIYDFSTAEGDILDLSAAFAGTIAKVDAFSKTAGQMTLAFAGGITTVRLDINGDGKVDYQVKINGDVTADSGGWLL